MKTVPERLAALGEIFKNRNATYGNTYTRFGKVMKSLIPDPVTIDTEEDWNRIALLFHVADKIARYSSRFKSGGHVDSLDDISVYSQMLQEYDHAVKMPKARRWKDPPWAAKVSQATKRR